MRAATSPTTPGATVGVDLALKPADLAAAQVNQPAEQAADNLINPAVLWTLTPRIISLDTEYFGVMWPNNAAVGASYGGILAGLAGRRALAGSAGRRL